MSTPTISASDIVPHIPALAALIARGWTPCINILEGTYWHVSMTHQSLGTPTVSFSEGRSRCSWDGSPLNIHARAPSLDVALEQAITQAERTEVAS